MTNSMEGRQETRTKEPSEQLRQQQQRIHDDDSDCQMVLSIKNKQEQEE